MKKKNKLIAFLLLTVFQIILTGQVANAIQIDPGVPPGGYPPETLPLPVYYEFRTSWDNIEWTLEQKESARNAFNYLGDFFIQQLAFQELSSPDDFTIRWAGNDLFRDWGQYSSEEWDYSTALAMAVKPRPDNSTPWSQTTYPYNEIYINSTYNWHYNPFTDPAEGDPTKDDDGEFDFWSVLLHETIHMLCVDEHAPHKDEVMYAYLSDGERKWQLKDSDLQLLRKAGYNVVPEPTTLFLFCSALVGIVGLRRKRLFRKA